MSGAGIQLVRISDEPPEGFETLRQQAADEGYGFLDRLAGEIARGDYAGDRDLPVLLAAFLEAELVGIGGLTSDPYDAAPDLARLRHVYVSPDGRRCGIGRNLAAALVQQGLAIASRLSLRAADERAARFWVASGFIEVDDVNRTHLLVR